MDPYRYGYGYEQPQQKSSSAGIIIAVVIVIVLLIVGYFVYVTMINTNSGGLLRPGILESEECRIILSPIDRDFTLEDLQEVYSYHSHLDECINDCNDLAKAYMYAMAGLLRYGNYPETSPEVINLSAYVTEIGRVLVEKFGDNKPCETEVNAEFERASGWG